MKSWLLSAALVIAAGSLLHATPARGQAGHLLNGVGPVDQGMSGAGMAAPQDALTALHWNPASVFAVPGRSLDLSLQVMQPSGKLSSSVGTGAFGMVPDGQGGQMPFPWQSIEGSTDSDAGPFPIPSVGYLAAPEDSRFAYGLSAFGVGGFGVDYALSPANVGGGMLPANPLLSPQQPLGGVGFGALSSTFMLLQVSPTFAWRLSDRIWIGAAPTLNLASLELSVFPATAPQMIDTPMGPLPLYPDAPAAWAIGFGFQVGVHATSEAGFSAGFTFKSRQAFQDFEFSPETPGADDFTFRLDYPMVLSGGVAYSGVPGLLVAADVRYVDFEHTTGFDVTDFGPRGEVLGFGWKSITIVAVGAQLEVLPGLPVRVGYSFNGNPVDDDVAFFNTPAPAIIEQHVSGGASYRITDRITASLAVQWGIANEVEGAWKTISPADGSTVSIPNTSVTSELATMTVIGGIRIGL